jgi:serine/threonine-protein kinase HipA
MPRARTYVPLKVYLNSRLVGNLRRLSTGAIEFQYDADWVSWEYAMPVSLSLPLREDRYTGDRVIPVLENLLPDAEPIRRRIAERVGTSGYDAFSLLSKIGRDCVGALQFLPEEVEPGEAGILDADPLSEESVSRILKNLSTSPLGLEEEEDFRISIAGAQEKTALLRWRGRWHVPHGPTPTTHIFKPQIGKLPNGIDLSRSVENEYLCMKLMKAFGLPTASVEIADFHRTRALVIERFDRRWTEEGRLLRLPQEDCCQALSAPPSRKYEAEGGPGIPQVLELLTGSDTPDRDKRFFLKSQILFWLLGATDGHAKNFSIHLSPGGRFSMTPIYDVMSAQPAVDAGQIGKNRMKLAMAVGENRHYPVGIIAPRHFTQTASEGGIAERTVEAIFEEIVEAANLAIDSVLSGLPARFPQKLARSIVRGFKGRLRLLERRIA